ncbi:MAG TPA: hypothetical protein VE028_09970 [Nitratidesulfovibrio sp.]|nr:hypothetical protein [Nitratidesulfovibrio sp.]
MNIECIKQQIAWLVLFICLVISFKAIGFDVISVISQSHFFIATKNIAEFLYYISGIILISTAYYSMKNYNLSITHNDSIKRIELRKEINRICDMYLNTIMDIAAHGFDSDKIEKITQQLRDTPTEHQHSETDELVRLCDRLDLIAFQIIEDEFITQQSYQFIGKPYIDEVNLLEDFLLEVFNENYKDKYKHLFSLRDTFESISLE